MGLELHHATRNTSIYIYIYIYLSIHLGVGMQCKSVVVATREGPETKSGSLEHFLRIDQRGERRGGATSKEGHRKKPLPKQLTFT